ncbi:methyltransferase family protein [Phytoactinopolyspora halotolerans]|uniref:Isoprenylcysteine carboxylmethyltransferase family protein n=1 Tax=Phytoactinopolyspora halotolerans TaxID=1981512 RepID=A0A6L9SDL7_9ACTN|nr:isoprenylcysteine carboxylmethyltransferase family protein [Phytoactinopolyspora halotolerans]NEE02591.1 isoprenylcysteine carboxylmethyltransferase family protein [Phytoactinopolyspora halotolerans]
MEDFIRVIATVMTAANALVAVVATRWERPGRTMDMRATVRIPGVIRWCSGPLQVIPLAFPALVAIAPSWTFTGPLNWPPVPIVTGAGALVWAAGISLLVWAESVMRGYAAVSGATVGHRLVTAGPYRLMRHPIYTAMIAVAVGTSLVFASWLLAAMAALSIALHLWWATAEERLLASDAQLGAEYRMYASRTGRFLPRPPRSPNIGTG